MSTPSHPQTSQPSAAQPLAVRLAHALSTLAAGLPNPWDESTDYFSPFHAELPAGAALDEATLRAALQVSSRYRLDIDGVDLDAVATDWGDEEAAAGFRLLDAVMQASLSDLCKVSARAEGVVRVRTWVVGRFASGWLVGLRTETTET